jgi:hypothetical protein
MFNPLILIISLAFISCSSLSEKTLSSMDDKDRPAWANQEKVVSVKDGKMLILGFQEVPADAKISAAFRLSDNSARTELSKMVDNQFSSVFQNLEEGLGDDGNLSRFYASEVSKNVLRELKIASRYWEKVQSFDRDGLKTFRLRVYSLAEIPEVNYKRLVRERIEKDKIDPEVKKQVLGHFENEINSFQSK